MRVLDNGRNARTAKRRIRPQPRPPRRSRSPRDVGFFAAVSSWKPRASPSVGPLSLTARSLSRRLRSGSFKRRTAVRTSSDATGGNRTCITAVSTVNSTQPVANQPLSYSRSSGISPAPPGRTAGLLLSRIPPTPKSPALECDRGSKPTAWGEVRSAGTTPMSVFLLKNASWTRFAPTPQQVQQTIRGNFKVMRESV